MAMPNSPEKTTVRMYNVGFGDCFLLTFHYAPPLEDRHILIDFGSAAGGANLKQIAADIKKQCGGRLYAVVATHRHRDHVNGFSDVGGKESPGAIIASCKPEIVVQPWTENPDAGADATSAPLLANAQPKDPRQLFFASLNAMQAYAQAVVQRAPAWRGPGRKLLLVEKLAANNITNPDAVRNLRTMGQRAPRFLQCGSPSGLENDDLLPGVKVKVLGPPSLEQQNLRRYASKSDEYWLASRFWGLQRQAAAMAGRADLFPREPRYAPGSAPLATRWFMEHAQAAAKDNTLAIVTMLDSYLNNTSLILLFEAGGKKLLFPGDAQLEDWQWALGQEGIDDLLRDVDLYKVGHHGSRNATPRSLWSRFGKRKSGLVTLLSTAAGAYGRSAEGKVPSENLLRALRGESKLFNTQDLNGGRGPLTVEIG
jgi:hypothetical protein